METNIHTHRSVRFSLRETRMLHMAPPTPGESADQAVREAQELTEILNSQEAVDGASMARVNAIAARLGELSAEPALAARSAALLAERTTLETARNKRVTNDTTLSALKAPNARDNRVKEVRDAPGALAAKAAFGAGKVKTYFEAIHKSADEDWHNVGGITREHAETIKLIVALDAPAGLSAAMKAHADANLTAAAIDFTTVPSPDADIAALGAGRVLFNAKVVEVDNACTGMPTEPGARAARVRAAKDRLAELTVMRTTGFTAVKNKMMAVAMPAGGAARASNAPDVLIFLANQREEVNREYFRVRNIVRSFDPTLSPTPDPSTPPTGGTLEALPTGINEADVNALVLAIATGRPDTEVNAKLTPMNTYLAVVGRTDADKDTLVRTVNQRLGGTRKQVRLNATRTALEVYEGVSTGVPTPEADRAIDALPSIRTHLRTLVRLSAAGKPVTDPEVVAAYNAIKADYAGFTLDRVSYVRNLVTALSTTNYEIYVNPSNPNELLLRARAVPITGPSTGPVSAAELAAALPPLPAGLERPANRFLNEGLGILRLLNDVGVLPEPLLRAMNSMNGREITQLNRQLAARRTQLNQARTELASATDPAVRTGIERRIRALEQDIAAREEQIRQLGGAVTGGSPESRRMMGQLLRMFLGMQRGGQGLGVMPWARRNPTGSYGFDLYGLNNGGNLVMGHAARMYGNQFGYYPHGGASIINYGPMYVNGGGVSMGGGYGVPGRLPFPPRGGMPPTGPFPGGGYVMGGGYFSGRKPSGSDSRPR